MKTKAIKYLNDLINDNTTKKEIDLIDFIKRCVREYKEEEKRPNVDWETKFETLWRMYPRKINKQLAKRTFSHKVQGLNEQECVEKCNQIYKVQMILQKEWESSGREKQYIPHYSSFLNANVPNSKYYKGR